MIEPTTVTLVPSAVQPRRGLLGGKGAQIVESAVEQVLAQVEEACPERLAVGRGREPGRVRKALESADEHGQLEVGVRHAVRGGHHAGRLSTASQVTTSPGPGSPYQERPSAPAGSSSSR